MKVSIVIPAYNEERFIAGAIKAALAQKYEGEFEVIVVDNGSKDKTAEIASSFPITLVKEIRKGSQYARNAGYLKATGDIIANTDADCLPGPDWISKGASLFKEESTVAVSGPYHYYDNGVIFGAVYLFIHKYVQQITHYILQKLKLGGTVMGGNVFIRRTALEKMGGYDTSLEFYGDDTSTAKRLIKVGTVLYDRNLLVEASAKRFQEKGVIRLTLIYLFHFLKIIVKSDKQNLDSSVNPSPSVHQ